MTEPTETTRSNWRRTHPNPLAETFAPGTEIRHLNPSVAEWRGTVAPEPDTRQFIRTRDMRVWGKVGTTTEVYVWWDNPSPWASPRGWFDAEVIAPVDAVDHAASIDVLRFPTRISNCLKRNGIRTVGDLLAKRQEDLTDLTNFGDNALAEVMATLGKRGLELQETFVPLRAETVRVMAEIAGGQPVGFDDLATSHEHIAEAVDRYRNGNLTSAEALDAIHEQVGDKPGRLGEAS